LTNQTGGDVSPASGGKPDNQAHRSRRIGLRPCHARRNRERGSTRCDVQKLTTWKFHHLAPSANGCTHTDFS
jgi:hypothetical protein